MGERKKRGRRRLGQTLIPFLAFFFWGAWVAQATEDAECLQCHKNPRLSKGNKDGSLLSLYVNEEAFKKSVHGASGMGCVVCHQEAKPDVHPAEGFPQVGCTNCHQDSAEAYKQTSHGMMLESGMEGAPQCVDCHTAHYVRKIADPQSPVNATRLPEACAKCHEAAKPPRGFLMALATYRITGHPKTDLGGRYDTQGCANCHPENAGHPQKKAPPPSCVKCHDPSHSRPLLLGPIHFKVAFWEQPVPFLLRFLYGAGLILVVLACVSFFGYRTYTRKKGRTQEKEKPAEGQGTPS
ncbi:MAG: cytochrome c3 family protein [Syntrophaceae bacterium]|nr:cytochrome c3 family protein [Syntrophaceae bacterium]